MSIMTYKYKNRVIKKDKDIITNNMLDYIKNNDEVANELLGENNNIIFKLMKSNGNIKVIKFGRCFICKRKIEGSEHHIISRENGGNDDNENKIFLCSDCHDDVELSCELCKSNIKQLCNKDTFIKCWIDGYPSNMKGCYNMINKNIISSSELDHFKCKDCKQKIIRISMWDKQNHLSNEWYASFKCTKCDKIYDIKMTKDIMNWVIDNVQVSFEK